MNDAAPLPEPVNHEAWAQALLQRQSALLEQLGEAALRMALAIERRLSEAPTDAPVDPAEAAMAFSRVSRAVRLTVMLQSKLVQELAPLTEAAERAARKARERQEPGYRFKARVEGVVERVAKARGDDQDALDRVVRETAERLDDEDFYGDVLDRPLGELVALICRDLGLDPDWSRLAQEAWAQAEAASGDPRSPFVTSPPGAASPAGGGGGPFAERSEERMAEGAGGVRHTPGAGPPQPLERRTEPGPAPACPLGHAVRPRADLRSNPGLTAPPQAGEHTEARADWIGV